MSSDNGKWTIVKRAWAPLLGVLVVGGLCYSLKLEGASVPGPDSAKERAIAKDDSSSATGSVSRVMRHGKAAGRVSIGMVPKGEYPIAPPVLVDPFNDEGDAYRKRTGATGPIPLSTGATTTAGGGACLPTGVACSFKADCDDGNPCTDDLCDIGPGDGACTGICKHDPTLNGQEGDCDDGVHCNGAELCQGASVFFCLGTCVGGPNNNQPCATDAANNDNCPNGVCMNKVCPVGSPPGAIACTYHSTCTTPAGIGSCSAPGNPCSGGTPQCNEITDSCQAACASDVDCRDATATTTTDGCTLDYCCIGGFYTRQTCVAGLDAGKLCDDNMPSSTTAALFDACRGSTCDNPVSVPCDVNGTCVRGNPCGAGGDCTPRFCDGGGLVFNLQPCVTNLDCGTGGTQGVCKDGTLCQPGRCCQSGSCERRTHGACTGAQGAKKWFAGDSGRVDGTGTACPTNVPCPNYGAGIGEQGLFTVLAGPTTLSPFNNLMSGAPLRKLGDDYDFGPVPALITITDMRVLGGVENISNSRTSFEFYDDNGVFIQDIFFITPVFTIAVIHVEFDSNQTPFDIPAKGFVVSHVLQAFAAPDINTPGEFFWMATDVVDHGVNDAANLFVDTDLNGAPVVTANFLKACVGGVRKGAPCFDNTQCPGSTCGSVPGILAFELEGTTQVTPPTGACCDNAGACTQELSWECIGGGRVFQGVGQDCDQCSDDSPNVGANCTMDSDCSFCVGGVNDGDPCTTNPECTGGVCAGTCEPACGRGACCNTLTGNCTYTSGVNAASDCTTSGGTFQGFGSSCDPNGCLQPVSSYTGADNCEDVIIHNIALPLTPGDSTTITITGDNTDASSNKLCQGGANDGDPCTGDAQCPGGLCVNEDSCYPPSVPGAELGWFEGFSINGCAYVRVDHCETDTNPGTPTINDPKIPSYRILYDNCPCGQTIFAKRDPNLPLEPPDARGAPYCNEDNAWGKYGPLRAGTYYYPILSFLGGDFGVYQLHITAKTCPVAACCHNICTSATGPNCPLGTECTGGEACVNGVCQELCDKDADCSSGPCESTCELLNILDCQDIGGAFLAPPNRGTAVTFCTEACDTGSCCRSGQPCLDEFPTGVQNMTIDNCDTLNGVYVGGFKCFGGSCNGGTRDGLSCQVDDHCPSGVCSGDAQSLGQPTPCPVCDIAGADNCQFFDDSVGIRIADLTLPGGGRAADDFIPNGNLVTTVCTWGVYVAPDEDGNASDCANDVQDNFQVTIYTSGANGLPTGAGITSQVAGANVIKALQEPTTYEDLNQIAVYAYKLTLDTPIAVAPGQVHWLEVNNVTDVPAINACLWSWMQTDFVYDDYSAAGAEPGYGVGAGRTADFAWCIDIDVTPAVAPERACCECSGTCSNRTKRDCDNAGNRWRVDHLCQEGPGVCVGGAPTNDNCVNVIAFAPGSDPTTHSVGEGTYVFDNHCTSTDGPNPIPDELGSASMASDVWMKVISNCNNSDLAITTCPSGTAGGGGIDTFIAVYHQAAPNEGTCVCPTAGTQAGLLWPNGLANDEGCTGILIGGGGVITTDSLVAADNVCTGDCYLIRVGGFAGQGSEEGTGTVVVDCFAGVNAPDPCGGVAVPPVGLCSAANCDKCIGGANNNLCCSQHSECPGGLCQLKNRFITGCPPVTAAASAPARGLKVEIVALDANSVATPSNYNGTTRWAGAPSLNVNDGTSPAFHAAQLQCGFFATDWSLATPVHLYGAAVVPASTYDLFMCDTAVGPCSTPALRVGTSKWGDIIAPLAVTNFQDIVAVVTKFQGTQPPPAAPSKTRTKLNEPVNPGPLVNFQDIAANVSAFQGVLYKNKFPTPPPTCP